MHTYLCILGRVPEISVEELLVIARRLGHIVEITPGCVVLQGSFDPVALLSRLGGTIKIARVEKTIDTWQHANSDMWLRMLRSELHEVRGKFLFGYSAYEATAQAHKHFYALGLSLKKHLKQAGISARLVSSKEAALSSVVVRKNNLIGRELVVVQGEGNCYLGRTLAVQDFDSYGLRDYGRPSRNMERGLLPPKLAQVMLNLAEVTTATKLLDPFCGGGTIVQEALLMGLRSIWGSDIDAKAIDETKKNIFWLSEQFKLPEPTLAVADALELSTVYPDNQFDAIVTEPFLGPSRILRQRSLTRADLNRIVAEIGRLYIDFFRSMAAIATPHLTAVVIFPIIRLFGNEYPGGNFEHIAKLGWKLQIPEVTHRMNKPRLSARGQLLYARDEQIVLREITVWKRAQ
jgi:tRNA G10  N-methylase Trm11